MLLLTILGLSCLFSSSYQNPANSSPVRLFDQDAYYPTLGQWSDTFDWRLLKTLSSQYKNLLISPISLKLVLGLIYEGSSGNTENELREVLQFNANKSIVRQNFLNILKELEPTAGKEYILDLESRVFMDERLEPKQKYQSAIKSFYKTDITQTNFSNSQAASGTINEWANRITHGKVNQLVTPTDIKDAIMIIANALFFKGTWHHQFPKANTTTGGFYISSTDIINVNLMRTTDRFYYTESVELDAKILRLPYKGQKFSFFVILPNAKGGLPDLIKRVHLQNVRKSLFDLQPTTVDVIMPKFKFDFQARYQQILQQFGIKEMFRNTASLAGIVRGINKTTLNRRLQVSDIIQKTGIELDEEGSVIYATSEIEVNNKFGEAENMFNATHPFLFFVEEVTQGSILFIGKVENPLEGTITPLPSRFNSGEEQGKLPIQAPAAQPLAGPNFQPSNVDRDSTLKRFNFVDFELLKEFGETSQNVFISPASIKTTLALIYQGACGPSADEIANILRIHDINDVNSQTYWQSLRQLLEDLNDKTPNTVLECSNAVFVDSRLKLKPEYERVAVQEFKALVQKLNFGQRNEAANIMNQWASKATHGIINQIITPAYLGADTKVILSNALYFKGKWKTAFDSKQTRSKCFNSVRGCVQAPFMQVSDVFNYGYNAELKSNAIELPYEDGNYCMLVLIPANGNVRALTKDLQHIGFNQLVDGLQPNDVILEMPRFEIGYETDLVEFLKPMKIKEVFGPSANLSRMIEQENVKISNIVHKAKIEVTEEGTKAAASTSAIVIPLMGSTAQRVVADRPFVFFIYHKKSRNIIFEGLFVEPPAQQQQQNPARIQSRAFYQN